MELPHSDFLPYKSLELTPSEQHQGMVEHLQLMQKRRSVREFSSKAVSQEVIEMLIQTAATAPSGANRQPYSFCAVANPKLKKKIREAAEKEEFINYHGRMDEQWLNDLKPLGTNWHKPYLETAPWLIVVFRKIYDLEDGGKHQNYYVQESVGIACGFLISAIHQAGLITLTHTPSPMQFLQRILKRHENERPFLLLPVGYPAEGAMVPNLRKKTTEEYLEWYL
jgi:nitroreductase